MKIAYLKKRLRKDRPKTTISLKLPDDVIADVQRIAPLLGFSNYQALIRAYIGQGLREDLERLESKPELTILIQNLRQHGVDEGVIAMAVAEIKA